MRIPMRISETKLIPNASLWCWIGNSHDIRAKNIILDNNGWYLSHFVNINLYYDFKKKSSINNNPVIYISNFIVISTHTHIHLHTHMHTHTQYTHMHTLMWTHAHTYVSV